MKIVSFIKEKANAVKAALTGVLMTAMTLPVFATYEVNPGANPEEALGLLLNKIIGITTVVGGIIALIGMVMIGVGLKDDESRSLRNGIWTLIGGIVVAVAPWFLQELKIFK